MNIQDARANLEGLYYAEGEGYTSYQYYCQLVKFINEVELLLKNNSIKQTPALFKPFDKGG